LVCIKWKKADSGGKWKRKPKIGLDGTREKNLYLTDVHLERKFWFGFFKIWFGERKKKRKKERKKVVSWHSDTPKNTPRSQIG
jgi:hypothetical protein